MSFVTSANLHFSGPQFPESDWDRVRPPGFPQFRGMGRWLLLCDLWFPALGNHLKCNRKSTLGTRMRRGHSEKQSSGTAEASP